MGVVDAISHDKYPKQGKLLNFRVRVCFNYNTDNILYGKVIRDDVGQPYETIIQLDNGWIIRSVECQYSVVDAKNYFSKVNKQ